MEDPFGIKKERLIKNSGVREIFTPNKPVNVVDLFFGRKELAKSIIESINTPGQHLLLYGDRGVGKSSLANITVLVLEKSKLINGKLVIKRCSSNDTFENLAEYLLERLDVENTVTETTISEKGTESADAKLFGIGASLKNEGTSTKKYKSTSKLTPSNLADYLKDKEGMYLVDEFDTLQNDSDKKNLAELIKLLSDYNSPFKIFVVGIAQSGTELTAGHPSVNRCLKEIKLERMKDNEIKEIIVVGMKKLSLEVSEQVVKIIVNISNGYPHFAHLMGLKCAEEAIVHSINKITKKEFVTSIDKAVSDAEGTMQRLYDDATQNSSAKKSKNIQFILKVCSTSNHEAFNLSDISIMLKKNGIELSNATISDYIRKFTGNNGDTILRRVKQGVYRFNDPRMQSYIKMRENVLERDRQKLAYGEV